MEADAHEAPRGESGAEAGRQPELDRLEKIASRVPGVVYQFRLRPDGTSCFPFASEALKRMYGVSPEEVREDASQLWASVHPEDQAGVAASVQASAQNLTLWQHEYRVKLADGTVRFFSGNAMPQREEDGSVLWHGFITDATERQQAEKELREGESRFQALFIQNMIGVSQMETATGRFVQVNARFCDMVGYTAEELQAMTYRDITHPEDLALSEENIQRHVAGKNPQASIVKRFLRKDGTTVWSSLTIIPLWNGSQPRDFHLALNEDITAQRQLEEQLRQSQKMEGIGQLAGGMAHEFNNILGAILLNLQLVQPPYPEPETRDGLQEIKTLSHRAAGLIKQLLAFSRHSVMQSRPLDLAALLEQQGHLLRPLLGEQISIEFSVAGGLPWVDADPNMMEQAILNLCLNARDAMRTGGRLRLGLAEELVGAARAAANKAEPGRFVCLSVADTGNGMEAATMKRLFEPFFTTKEVGQGTGLGLATVLGITQQHRGWVEVESGVGQGTTFRIYLPAMAPAPAAAIPGLSATVKPGKGMILLVEDEAVVRKATKRFLERQGYAVLEAPAGAEALVLWAQHRAEIDLVFTDMVMPGGLSGLQLAEKLLAEEPELRVIISSGYNTTINTSETKPATRIRYLAKPCEPKILAEAVENCLRKE